jgi:hypothetical protein
MPSVTLAALRTATQAGLTELGQQRLEVISFFLLVLIGCAWLVQRVWNSMRKELPVLPRLSFPRAVGVIVLWGLLFVLILTMISGARELMTPEGFGGPSGQRAYLGFADGSVRSFSATTDPEILRRLSGPRSGP